MSTFTMPTNTALSPDQLQAVLTEVSKNVTPAKVKPRPLTEQLAPHRKVLLKFRAKGYSAEQLASFLRHPKIGIEASPSFVRKFLLVQHRAPRAVTVQSTTKPTAAAVTQV